MISNEEIILNDIECYEKEFGLNWNQTVLTKVCLNNGFFKNKSVESVLNIFLFENFDENEAYLDSKKEYVNDEYVENNPQVVKRIIEENYEHY